MSKFNPFDPANGYSEEDRVALETKCASLINRAYRNPFPGASLRHDGADNAGIFFAKQLAHIKTKAYDKEFPELSGLKLFPQTSDTDEGASYIEYYSYEPVGFAAIIANYASDLPRVDVKGTPHRAEIVNIGDSYGYNVQELRACRRNAVLGIMKSLDAVRAEAARRVYDALWTDCDQQYVLAQWRLRHWTLSNSGKLEGCTAYSYQYTPAVAETGVKRVLVTKAQGANFLVGSAVCMGERGENTGTDRNAAYNHDIFNWAKISSITNVTVNDTEYVALNLELDAPIDTTTTMLVSTMPWESGTTEGVQGHSDGCRGNLTNGKYPYRVAGIEMQIGAYVEQLDPLWKASLVDDDHWHYDVFSCKSSEKQVGSISSDYAQTGSFDLNDKATWSWHYIRKLGKLGAEAMMYEKFNGSGSTYVRAAFVSPGSAGVYAPWRGGNLDDGANCGLPCANGNNGPGTANWNGVPRHADDKIALKRA